MTRDTVPDDAPLIVRFWHYQSERFPVFKHGILVAVFASAALSYSRAVRGECGLPSIEQYAVCAVSLLMVFFLLRVCDEFKDFAEDSRYRPYRPVPRGLISLKELALLGMGAVAVAAFLNALHKPLILAPLALVLAYIAFMTSEFFVPSWLKRHPMTYTLSHMVVMPLVMLYATGVDWIDERNLPPRAIALLMAVAYTGGMVIEIGRKVRAPEMEETGVETYSVLYGPRRATVLWLVALTACTACTVVSVMSVGAGLPALIVLAVLYVISAAPALVFLRTRSNRLSEAIDAAAGIWTLGAYLVIGLAPHLPQL
ncbi:MAG: UbiA family prenyltransferase [Chitinispirillaceae bacterium]|nr:UbiA family prenyltransferase [Chitinispirillaceae bacterium]